MTDMSTYWTIALGVFLAVLYPVLLGLVRKAFPPTGAPGLPPWVKKYGLLLIFSLVTAFLVLGAYRMSHPETVLTFWQAFFLGFGWEASVEKLLNPPKRPARA